MIVITGAGGLVGRTLCQHLRTAGYPVLALIRGAVFTVAPGEITLDLMEPAHYDLLLDHCAGCSAIIHLAGRIQIEFGPATEAGIGPEPCATAPRFAGVYEGNVVMTARLLELALMVNVPHVVFASSQTVYGLPMTARCVESSPLAPLEHYAASKVACETMLALWARGQNRKVTVLRFPGVWTETRSTGLVRTLCQQALEQSRVRVGADYPLPLDILHAEDLVAAFRAGLDRPGDGWRAYNISTGELCSLTRLGEDVAGLIPGCVVESFGVPQPDILLDSSRAAIELGWRAQPRRARLARFIDHLREVPGHA